MNTKLTFDIKLDQPGNNINNIYLMANLNILPDFKQFILDDKNPEAIILGDVFKDFNWVSLNKAFELLLLLDCFCS